MMKRPEIILGAVVLAFAAFVAEQSVRAPRRTDVAGASPESTSSVRVHHARSATPGPVPDESAGPSAARETRVEMTMGPRAHLSADERDDALRRIHLGGSATWFDDVLRARDSLVLHWAPRDVEPLRVWIAPGVGVANRRPAFDALVRDAFDQWQAAGARVRVTYVRDSAAADVPITWIDHFDDDRVGYTTVRGRDGVIDWGTVSLATHTRTGAELDERWLRPIALHEVGHLLGLPHAASDTGSVMRPQAALRALSAADRGTMRLLYMLPAGSLK